MGKGVVGKNSLTCSFINYNTPQEHYPTIEDRYKSKISIEGVKYNIEILNTSGEEDYQNMMDSLINVVDGFLLIYAINDEKVLKCLKRKEKNF